MSPLLTVVPSSTSQRMVDAPPDETDFPSLRISSRSSSHEMMVLWELSTLPEAVKVVLRSTRETSARGIFKSVSSRRHIAAQYETPTAEIPTHARPKRDQHRTRTHRRP